jgi:hypothetical protein
MIESSLQRARVFRHYGGVITARLNGFPILVSNLPPDSIHFGRGQGDWGSFSHLIGVLAMGTEYPQRNKQGRLGEPSLWNDEHPDDVHSPLEENARLRGLLVQLSDLIRRNVLDPK